MPKSRRPESYARRPSTREPYASVLIVCEGSKTEPHYLLGLRAAYRLSSANIRVTPADGTDPMSVVGYAETLFDEGDFDRAYCVFDRDNHPNYAQALHRIRQLANFHAVPSCPCFEIWILLHFVYSAAPRDAGGALAEVLRHYATYTKGSRTVFDDLSANLVDAIRRAKQLQADNERSGASNPATRMHELVEYLTKLNR